MNERVNKFHASAYRQYSATLFTIPVNFEIAARQRGNKPSFRGSALSRNKKNRLTKKFVSKVWILKKFEFNVLFNSTLLPGLYTVIAAQKESYIQMAI